MTTPLQAARDHLATEARIHDDAGDWRTHMLLSALYDVADYLCRIGDHDHSLHYQADKSGSLVHAAMRVRKITLERYGQMFDGDGEDDDPNYVAIEEAAQLLSKVDSGVEMTMWIAARQSNGGGELYRYQARDLLDAVSDLKRWADKVAATAVPDPVDE